MTKAKVLVISPGVLPLPPVLGGAVENLIARLHPALTQRFRMEYISVRPPGHRIQQAHEMPHAQFHYVNSINPLTDFCFENQFELHESTKWPGYLDFCLRVCQERRPEIIHVHNEAHLIPPLRKALPASRLLLHVNDEVVTRMNDIELRSLSESCDRILGCSRYIARQMKGAFAAANIESPPIDEFYNFVDTNAYNPETISPRAVNDLRGRLGLNGGPVLLFVGRMIEQKGPHLALRAFRRVLRAYPAAQMVFVGAPWYSRANESPFVQIVRSEAADIESHIRFIGYVDHSQMPAYYALADVVTAPSIWDDPSPFVTYEAQAMERPVITSARGGIPEIVEDHKTGRCIDVFNIPLFSQILDGWLHNPDEARTIGKRGRARIRERFELAQAQRQMAGIYQELLNHD